MFSSVSKSISLARFNSCNQGQIGANFARFASKTTRAFPVYKPSEKSPWVPLNSLIHSGAEDIEVGDWSPVDGNLKLPNGKEKQVKIYETKNGGWVQMQNLFDSSKK